ncbi:hypoxanthine phosphoribosyltransferase [Mycoplasma iguanae]|uniref:Hypoxanthine phosphoribosyltransferase n=1 Tax=Mycoplasma iguanae TaxID=292461 RepID=A0ABY5R7U0_9MOLU|nr:hypoxanthine phosphoribosyltransferase [Mycoplasma iguanae]UVD81578.1 hypoxanthine phosphoribosyltransferase [Mycoplasma iguanae]
MLAKNKEWVTEIIYENEEILNKIKEIARWANKEFEASKKLVLVGLLKGCIPFLAELIKHIEIPHILDFMVASSYGGAQQSSNTIKIIMDLNYDIEGMDVLVVEDIIDSGITLEKILNLLKTKNPNKIKLVTLIDKPLGRKVNIEVDKSGFILPDNKFLVGFGLDVKEKLRNLPYIGVFNKDKFDEL